MLKQNEESKADKKEFQVNWNGMSRLRVALKWLHFQFR